MVEKLLSHPFKNCPPSMLAWLSMQLAVRRLSAAASDGSAGESQMPLYEKFLLTVEETGVILGVSRGKVYSLINTGELPLVKLGKGRNASSRITWDGIFRLLQSQIVQN